jgi:hypothetical protein
VSGRSIDEVKIRLDGSVEHFTCELLHEDERGVVIRWLADSPLVAGRYQLPAGSLTTAFYWRGRGHNLYRPIGPDGHLICHRLDIIEEPLIEPGRVTFRDLLLDILVAPGGEPVLQDEEELIAAVAAGKVTSARARELLDYARGLLPLVGQIVSEAEAWLAEAEGASNRGATG